VPGGYLILRTGLARTVGRQAEQVSEARDGEQGRERPGVSSLDRQRDHQAGVGGCYGDSTGQRPRLQADLLLPLIGPLTQQR